MNTKSTVENLTKTLLYEGYSLFPYSRSSIKNKKPVPFGVVYPEEYAKHNSYVYSMVQTQCIIAGSENPLINVEVKFLHLLKNDLYKFRKEDNDFIPVEELVFFGNSFIGGWQAIERSIQIENLNVKELIKEKISHKLEFDNTEETKLLHDENGKLAGRQINHSKEIKGLIIVGAQPVNEFQNAYKISVNILNNSEVKSSESISQNEVMLQSYLSTHTILAADSGEFISDQNPGNPWGKIVKQCININMWPILIDKENSTILSSPIIIYDYPEINSKSNLDLFDSTEIEEALMLHVAVLSDEEKNKISQSDEKLNAMLNKVKNITPDELIKLHSGLEEISSNKNLK